MKYFFPLIIFFLLLFSTPQSFAFVVQGNSSSTSTSTTTIEGSGSVTTHIQSTVNGNTKTLDSDTPGTYILDNSSDDSQVSVTPLPSATPPLTITPTAFPTHAPNHHPSHILAGNMQSFFHKIIQKLLSMFHL